MNKIKGSILFAKGVLSSRKHLLISLFTSLFTFLLMYKFTLITVADESLGILTMMSSVNYVFFDLILLAIISVLFGVFVSLLVYKIKIVRQGSKSGFFGTLGLTIGLFGAGCPTCGAFLFSLIGMPLALTYLPFRGLELKVLSIVWLLFTNYFLIKSLMGCNIKFSKK